MRMLPVVATVLLASCGKKEEPSPNVQADKQTIWDRLKAFHSAGGRGDVDAMGALLSPDCAMFKGDADFVKGQEACLAEIRERVKSLDSSKEPKPLFGNEDIVLADDVAVARYMVSVGSKHAAVTAVLRRLQGQWMIVSLHESWK
jgi:ketosteroid isomerase-like protein